jgi:CzcA family heavy metal efflux pump
MHSLVGRLAVRHSAAILFLVVAISLAGGYASTQMPSAVFPQTNFPRVIVIVNNGVMPADEMMATVTRPIEEAMKDIQGCRTIRSSTGRGTAEIDLFFTWDVDMAKSELYVQGRIAQIRSQLPSTATADVYRMTFSSFPIAGISLTMPTRTSKEGHLKPADQSAAWELAQYEIEPTLLRIPGVARVDLVGGRPPQYAVIIDPLKLAALHLSMDDVTAAFEKNNLVVSTGFHEEDYHLSLGVVDGRARSIEDIENFVITADGSRPVPVRDFARVERGPEPGFDAVTADGTDAVLLNIFSQPDASTLQIANDLKQRLAELRPTLPPTVRLAFFYDQSLLVRESVNGVWEAIIFGLILSVLIVYLFLKDWGMTLTATLVIPVTVLFTILAMKVFGLSFNLMTLGGIAAAIGLVIDDAIVVVEAIHAKIVAGMGRLEVIESAVGEILPPLLGSTLTPVVVFIPLAFLTGITGVFFRALALTMVVALLTSLLLAVTLTPCLAAWFVGKRQPHDGGIPMRATIALYEWIVRLALRNRVFTVAIGLLVLAAAVVQYGKLRSDFLPKMDEGGFIIDYVAPPGISLAESDRQMRMAEAVLAKIPEIASYSRRTGTALGVHLVEPNTGDFLVKLRSDRKRTSSEIIGGSHGSPGLRDELHAALPRVSFEYPGILTDLIGDLTWSDEAIEIKILSNDLNFLRSKGPAIESRIQQVSGVVDTFNGLVFTGPTIRLKLRGDLAAHLGLTTDDVAKAVNIAMLGQVASDVLEGDHVVNIRITAEPAASARLDTLRALPIRTASGTVVPLDQVVDIEQTPGQLELERDDLRQDIAVTANLQGRDLGSAMKEIKDALASDPTLPTGSIEYGGLYEQQQESFRNLAIVLAVAVVLVFTVALLEFGAFAEPIAIVFGAILSVFGITAALLLTGTSLNIITFLGAIIGMGIVHKNGLLMLDSVKHLRAGGLTLNEALVQSGQRRLRPVLMTSLAAALGMLPLALGVGSADMLRPLAIAVIGAVCVSVLLSLVATPVLYSLLREPRGMLILVPAEHEFLHERKHEPAPEDVTPPTPIPMVESLPEPREATPTTPPTLPDWHSFGPR